ncbi:hypothetical protein Q4493_00070 [Colwellia sp. 1_MG-2023]|uniref:SMP-30/gluconolactonase/LRE family protein n=1 Tax=Colwellia sp. 1_MG-2023 TaxID=3062649 RepID=UPI0026E2B6AE|nr:hypothetical protein [Colwellia sp. 1_MG-2023]MDO6444158.1 hypothetical protein [Colwellia sp. 1_MG-2023]
MNNKNRYKNLITSAMLLTSISGCTVNAVNSNDNTTRENKTIHEQLNLQGAKLFANLPESCPTPDGLAIAPNGSLTLACTNYANKGKKPGTLLSIASTGEITPFSQTADKKKKGVNRPMGIAYAPDGSLYICDSGRVLRLTFIEGKIATTEVVAHGLTSPNGIRIHNNSVYVSLLQMKNIKSANMTSAIYRFSLDDRGINVKSTKQDEQMIFSVETKNPARQFGLDGLVFDKEGHLYTGNFGDGEIYQLTLSENGKAVIKKEIYAQLPKDTGLDGITIDESGNLYVAGFLKNQIIKVDTNRNTSVLAEYPDNNGENGELDQPSEVLVYGDKLIISNFDLMAGKGIVNSKHSAPYTLSYINLTN